MILDISKVKIGDWIVTDRCLWWGNFYILPGARLKIVNIPLSNNGRVRLSLDIAEFVQIFPEFSVEDIAEDFSLSGKEPEGVPRQRSRYDIAKKEPISVQYGVQFSEVIKIIKEKLGIRDVTETSRFIDDLGMDSLDLVELIIAFEEGFDIGIDNEEIENIKTVGEAYKFLKNKVKNELL